MNLSWNRLLCFCRLLQWLPWDGCWLAFWPGRQSGFSFTNHIGVVRLSVCEISKNTWDDAEATWIWETRFGVGWGCYSNEVLMCFGDILRHCTICTPYLCFIHHRDPTLLFIFILIHSPVSIYHHIQFQPQDTTTVGPD